MGATVIDGTRVTWEGERDDEGHRTWTISHYVEVDSVNDGPATVMQASGLPAVGSTWSFGTDIDVWAFCYPYMKVAKHSAYKEGEWIKYWKVDQKFSTKPLNRCGTATIEDPLDEPQKISGSFVKYTKEGTRDRWGAAIRSSSFEPFHGQQVEFDHNRPTVKISQNVASLGLSTFAAMIDCVNDATLWGLPPRCVKLSNVSWERLLYGTCSYYYTRNFEFDCDYNSFDRFIIDEGNKVLNGQWNKTTKEWELLNINGAPPDPNNPLHFCKAVDFNNNPIRIPLNGAGLPISTTGSGTGSNLTVLEIEFYHEANFLSLNIPSSL